MRRINNLLFTLILLGVGTGILLQNQRPSLPDSAPSPAPKIVPARPTPPPAALPAAEPESTAPVRETQPPEARLARQPIDRYAETHEELWATLDPADYAIVEQFSQRYHDALQFENHAQLLWMQRHGYPMPEDIAVAATMSTEQLRQLADGGHGMAATLLVDRLITEAAALGKKLVAEQLDPWIDPDFFEQTRLLNQYLRPIEHSGTPFSGYMDARAQLEVWGVRTPREEYSQNVEIALQGLAYAHSRGDILARNRAEWLADEAGISPDVFEYMVGYDNYVSSFQGFDCQPGGNDIEPMPYDNDP